MTNLHKCPCCIATVGCTCSSNAGCICCIVIGIGIGIGTGVGMGIGTVSATVTAVVDSGMHMKIGFLCCFVDSPFTSWYLVLESACWTLVTWFATTITCTFNVCKRHIHWIGCILSFPGSVIGWIVSVSCSLVGPSLLGIMVCLVKFVVAEYFCGCCNSLWILVVAQCLLTV